jgi:23S rRNA (cytosine1962-C5)-methyltransferase
LPEIPTVHLTTDSISAHPWIFQRSVKKPQIALPGGSVVDIVSSKGRWLGRGFYNGHARIGLRILSRSPSEEINAEFFEGRIKTALELRHKFLDLKSHSTAYRLLHGEVDGIPGLVVDKFNDLLVLEFYAAGPFRWRQEIKNIFLTHFPDARFYWFAERHVQKQESFDCHSPDNIAGTVITEHGLKFSVTPGTKHKTGFFVDQRDNRLALTKLTENARVLDLCCFSGGFSIYAKALGKAREVIGVDLDEEALIIARENATLNNVEIQFETANMFDYLTAAVASQDQYDVVILDPPKQTRSKEGIEDALKRYTAGHRLGLAAVKPGGVLLTCSCSGLISEEDFIATLARAANQIGRTAQIFHVSGPGGDHPFLGHVPEGRYLKAIWARVL